MGGFHGGHGGGHSGGFHGGHSSGFHGGSFGGGFHGSGHRVHYHGGHYIPDDGMEAPVHEFRGGRHYINGKIYYGPYYGFVDGDKSVSYKTAIITGISMYVVGIILFFLVFMAECSARITKVNIPSSTYQYSYSTTITYEYEYTFYGHTYYQTGEEYVVVCQGQMMTRLPLVRSAPFTFIFILR